MKLLNLIKRNVLLFISFLLVFLLSLSKMSFAVWEQVNDDGFGLSTFISSMAEFDGYLYVETGNDRIGICQVWRSSDGTDWNLVVDNSFGDSNNTNIESMAVFYNYQPSTLPPKISYVEYVIVGAVSQAVFKC